MANITTGKLLVVHGEDPIANTHDVAMTLTQDGLTIAAARATAATPEIALDVARRQFVESLKSRWGIT